MKRSLKTSFLSGSRWLLGATLLGTSAGVCAAPYWFEAGDVDKSKWDCKYCAFETGLDGEIQVGIGTVADDDQYGFGNFTGWDEGGSYGILGTDLYYRGEDAHYWFLRGANLGLDSRQLRFEGGRQGVYRVRADYSEIPRLRADNARTPFSGAGTGHLTLPFGWVDGGTTTGMTELNNSLQSVELRTDRQRFGVGVMFTPSNRWSYSASVRREEKEGVKPIGGSFVFRSALLPEPVDYTTDQVELSLGYHTDKGHLLFGYLVSTFKDENDALLWDNPFTSIAGADEGQMALPPDNTFHQLSVNGNYRFNATTVAEGRLVLGRMRQDEQFLPYTVNPLLATSPLPRDSLEGEVRTTTLDARVVSKRNDKLTLQGKLRYHDRDNRTPVDSFNFVSTDTFLPGARSNRLYHRTNSSLEFTGRYRMTPATRISAGAEYEAISRPDQEVEKTREGTLWGEVATRPHETTELVVRLAHADRDASDYRVLASTMPPQNPLLVKFNMAERVQERADAWFSVTPNPRLHLGAHVSYRDNDYSDTDIGLYASRDTELTLDGAFEIIKDLHAHAFITKEKHKNEQAGSQTFSVPDWFSTTEDVISSFGFGVDWRPLDSDYEFGVEYVYSEATGKVDIRDETDFPDLKNKIHSANAHIRYRLSKSVSTELAIFYERFESEDWSTDGIQPDTIPEVLTLGADSADYRNHAIALILHYRF